MEDQKIVALYWERDEKAIEETDRKYGHYLKKIAYHILSDLEDSRECVNDTYLKAWNSIPPRKPEVLSAYLGRITRQVSIDVFRRRTSKKRNGSQYAVSLSELEECVSAGDTTVEHVNVKLLAEAISRFLRALPPEARITFVGRYYFMDSIDEIASYCGMSAAKTKSMLHRTRLGLKAYLEQEGFK